MENSSGTDRFVVDGSGNITLSGATTVSGAGTFSGGSTLTGDIRIASPVLTGASSTITAAATSSVTAAQACDNGIVNFSTTAGTGSTTLPTAASMYADCLTTTGDEVTILFRNLNSASTTILIAGTSSTMVFPEATGVDSEVNASGWSWITFMRVSDGEMFVSINEFVDAD